MYLFPGCRLPHCYMKPPRHEHHLKFQCDLLILFANLYSVSVNPKALLAKVDLENKIHALPDDLSGGQRQRIGIARALYYDPEILVFDEATSSLDNITEQAVMDALHNVGEKKTVIIVAHRITTVKKCDQIFILENGEITGAGGYQDLMNSSDVFREMVQVSD